MTIRIHPHAMQRMRERGATALQVRQAVLAGRATAARFGRIRFRRVLAFGANWNGKRYAKKQLDVFAAKMPDGWLVVTVIVRYF